MSTEKGEKDRWGDKLRDVERAREELHFAEREKELLAKLKQKNASKGTCPSCAAALEDFSATVAGSAACPSGHGIWLGASQVADLATRTGLPVLRVLDDHLKRS